MRIWHSRSNARRTPHAGSDRVKGDQARDRRAWGEAARFYQQHVADHPDDADIWIQLGHAQKESGELDAALHSYEHAERLRPDDADLLLSFGHLHKVRGDVAEATRFYSASARLDGNPAAKEELGRLSLSAPHAAPKLASIVATDAIVDAVSPLSVGLTPIATSGLTRDAADRLVSTNNDPWIEFAPAVRIAKGTRAALLVIDIATLDDAPLLNGQLYVDYGTGFDERHSIALKEAMPIRVMIACPRLVTRLRWDPDTKPGSFTLASVTFTPLRTKEEAVTAITEFAPGEHEVIAAGDAIHRLYATASVDAAFAATVQQRMPPSFDAGFYYDYWLERYIEPQAADYDRMREMVAAMPIRPRFSFLVPVYDPPVNLLRECIDAMLAQVYPADEICLSDDNSPNPEVRAVLEEYAAEHANVRIAFRRQNGHISANSNSALALATGDFVVLVDHDDLVPDYALLVIADAVNGHPDASIFYSDEDKINLDGVRHSPYFKGDFNKFLMFGHNMVSHLGVYRRSLVEEVGGFRQGLEGSQDYDLLLRCYEQIGDDGIIHIPHVLYHWRTIPGSTSVSHDQKDYAIVAAKAAITGFFERTGAPMRSIDGFAPGLTGLRPTREFQERISIIIPTRDGADDLRACLASILSHSPDNIEILIVDNGSTDKRALDLLTRVARDKRIRVIRHDAPFNFSEINNLAAEQAAGEILCFLNNDTEVRASAWLDRARMLLTMKDVGMVGARLVYPDGHLQHFGIGIGMADHRIAGSPHLGLATEQPGYFGKARLIQEFSAVTAACMFVRREDFLKVGGFDPALRIAYNDVDLCMRFRELGLRIVCDPEIELVHKESRSRGSDITGANRERLDQEAALMHRKWGERLERDPYLSPNHDPKRPDFALAYPPAVPMPWRRSVVSVERA